MASATEAIAKIMVPRDMGRSNSLSSQRPKKVPARIMAIILTAMLEYLSAKLGCLFFEFDGGFLLNVHVFEHSTHAAVTSKQRAGFYG